MKEFVREVRTADGAMRTFFACDYASGLRPVVIVLMDAPGVREALRDIARTIAADGYLVALPDLYYRTHPGLTIGPTRSHPDADANRKRLGEMVATLSNARVAADVSALLDWVQREKLGLDERAAIVGYCMSGAFAVAAAAAEPSRIRCVASYYGTRLVTDAADSPHRIAAESGAEMYFAFADHDPFVPPAQVEALRAQFASHGLAHAVETYPGSDHGFVFPDRGTYHADAAERHWRTLRDLLTRNLG